METKVLLVEDDLDYREVIHFSLELSGFLVINAGDGKAAVEIAKKQAPNIVLMDFVLPVMGGLDATRRIKRDAATTRIPVIIYSAHCWDPDTKRDALGAGAIECLNKPLDFESLPTLLAGYALNDSLTNTKAA